VSKQEEQPARARRPRGADKGADDLPIGSTLMLIRKLFTIAGPVVLTQLGLMAFGVVDTLMVGRVGIAELDAAALGNVWFWGTMILGVGIVYGLDPIIAQAHGRGDGERAGLALQQGMIVSTLVSIPLIALGWMTQEVLVAFGQDPVLARMAEDYMVIQQWSIAPLLWFYTLRQYLQGREIVAPALWLALVANVFNVIGNEALIYGVPSLGVPEMGLRGAGLASGCTRAFMAVGLVVWTWAAGLHRGAWLPWSRRAFEPRGLLEVLRYGLPVGLHYTLEIWAFQLSTLLAGELGRNDLAAHTIVLNIASVTFMVPMGISFGASTVIGNLIGKGRLDAAQRTAWIAFALGGGVMLMSALVLVSTGGLIPSLYTDEAAVIVMATSIIPIAAAFQLFDGLQVVGGGILRAAGDTLPAAMFNGVAYYVFALPLAAYLVLVRGGGLEEIWWSMALGLALVAGALVLWVRWRGPGTRARDVSDVSLGG
jgi:MATE family multidrug resistance protein